MWKCWNVLLLRRWEMKMAKVTVIGVLVLTGLVGLQDALGAYNVIDVGVLGSNSTSHGYGLSEADHVVGRSAGGHWEAFSWQSGSISPLGFLAGGDDSEAYGVNSSGVVVGQSDGPATPYSGFVYDGGSMTDLPEPSGQSWSLASDINDSGVIAGKSGSVGVRWSKSGSVWSVAATLTVSGRNEAAGAGINAAGDCVGDSYHPGAGYRAIHWAPGSTSGTVLPYAGGSGSWELAFDINNDADTVVGYSISGGIDRAAVWTHDGANWSGSLLGNLGGAMSQARAVNNSGVIVGYSEIAAGGEHAFIYDSVNGLVDLNTLINPGSGWVLTRAYGINESGHIAGYGTIGGYTHAFLLVPEPATIALLGMSFVGLLRRRRSV